jgi:hypothetical protein
MFFNRHIIIPLLVSILFLSCSKKEHDSIPETPSIKIDFVKTLGGSLNERGQALTKTIDGGYAILGYTQSSDEDITNKLNDSFDYWLLKYDQNNTLEWQKTYGGKNDDRGTDLIQTSDGGFAIIGYSNSNDGDVNTNNGANDFWICKLDALGNISWEKSFGFLGADSGNTIIQTQDQGYLISGVLDVSASNGAGNSKTAGTKHAGGDYWAIKLNTSGEKEWSHYYGGTFTDIPYDAIQTDDRGYILVGSSDSNDVDIKNNKGTYDFWVIKISPEGSLIWEKSFGGSQIDEAYAITKSIDGNYLIVGDTRSNNLDVSHNNGAADLWIIKISPEGNLIWEHTYGGSSFDVGRSISNAHDGGFIISGSSRSADGDLTKNNGQNDAWILKIDANGNLIWQKTIGGSNIDFAFDAIELNDESIITIGESSSSDIDINSNKGFSDVLIFKINKI